MGHECAAIIAFFFTLLTFVAIAISFSCPEWYKIKDDSGENETKTVGLWLKCRFSDTSIRWEKCKWVFNDPDFWESKKVWYTAVEAIFATALVTSIMALISSSCTCVVKCTGAFPATCALSNLTFLLVSAAVATFGTMAYIHDGVMVMTSNQVLGWAYWVAVSSTGLSLIATGFYYFLSRSEHYYNTFKYTR